MVESFVFDPAWIVSFSALGALGYFPIYYLIFQRDFNNRYKLCKDKIEKNYEKELNIFFGSLNDNLKKGMSPKDFHAYILKWSEKQDVSLSILTDSWNEIIKYFPKILCGFVLTFIFTGYHMLNPAFIIPQTNLNVLNIAGICLIVEYIYIISFFNDFNKLSVITLKIENNIPIEIIFEKEIGERVGK